MPNHSTTIGASAIFGTLLMATIKGSTRRATNTEYQSASPSREPTMVPMTKPRIASNSVNQVSPMSSPLAIIRKPSAKMPEGDPTRKAEIQPMRTPISHAAKKATTASTCSAARPSVVSKLKRRGARAPRFGIGPVPGSVRVTRASRSGCRARHRAHGNSPRSGRRSAQQSVTSPRSRCHARPSPAQAGR